MDLPPGMRGNLGRYAWIFAFISPTMAGMGQDDRHRVYMSFQVRQGWHYQFLEPDLKTSLPRGLHFNSADKVVELAERGGGISDQESRLMLNRAIDTGRGGVYRAAIRVLRTSLSAGRFTSHCSSTCRAPQLIVRCIERRPEPMEQGSGNRPGASRC